MWSEHNLEISETNLSILLGYITSDTIYTPGFKYFLEFPRYIDVDYIKTFQSKVLNGKVECIPSKFNGCQHDLTYFLSVS